MKITHYLLFAFSLAIFASACGSGGIQTSNNGGPGGNGNNNGNGPMTTAQSFANASTQLNAFGLGGDFPPDIQIPSAPGMESTAFVTSYFPAAVIALDLNSNPPHVSSTFMGFDASGVGVVGSPNNGLILNPNQALISGTIGFAGVSGLALFNPTTGALSQTVNLSDPINLTQALPYSQPGDCNGDSVNETSVGPGPYSPNFAADLAVLNNRLFVSMSNLCFDSSFESFYVQGLVLVYDIHSSAPFLTPASTPYIVLNGFNATGLTVVGDHLIATSTGDTSYTTGVQLPQTASVLDEIDPNLLAVTRTLNLGEVAANFQSLALSSDQSTGFIGSSSFSEVYAIDLDTFTALRGENNPILIFDDAIDYINDQEVAFGDQVLFVSSFNHSAVKAIDLTSPAYFVLPGILDFSFSGNPGLTGAGPMALRPGQPGVDFQGPDLWVLTGSPGTVSNATTY